MILQKKNVSLLELHALSKQDVIINFTIRSSK
jgi:hypothetical protein